MALKMRFLYFSKKSKMKELGEAIKNEFDLSQNHNAIDIIPPAYSCENERLVILALSGKGEMEDHVRRFCRELDKKKAQNVALLIDGDEKLLECAMATLKETGTNIIENVKTVKFGGFALFGGKLEEAEKQDILAWVHDVVATIK